MSWIIDEGVNSSIVEDTQGIDLVEFRYYKLLPELEGDIWFIPRDGELKYLPKLRSDWGRYWVTHPEG